MVEEQVKGMVEEQLRAAGFDQDLSAGDLTLRSSVRNDFSYAGVLEKTTGADSARKLPVAGPSLSKADRQEEKFWKARRSLRFWPIEGCEIKHIEDFLVNKLKICLLYTSPSPRDRQKSRMPSSA